MGNFKQLTLLGIRPDYIRMQRLIPLLDRPGQGIDHVLAHSGQHYDPELYGNFLSELNIRQPDVDLGIGAALRTRGIEHHAAQVALLGERVYDLLGRVRPDAVLMLGDTNTVLAAVTVARCGVPVIHLEAGGRSFDWRMPEEKNRIVADHLADACYCYLDRYRALLEAEGIAPFRITVIGNIIVDALEDFLPAAAKSSILKRLKLTERKFLLLTLHREENIAAREILERKLGDVVRYARGRDLPVVFPVMPRVREALERFKLSHLLNEPIVATVPLGFLDFLRLEQTARLVVSDSGTVQEECLLVGTPCAIARRSTERPETIWAGATVLEGIEGDGTLVRAMAAAATLPTTWDRAVLNPTGGSPSVRVHQDLLAKVAAGFFKTPHSYQALRENPLAREAYGEANR